MLADGIFKANDIRGLVSGPQIEWDSAGAEALGQAFGRLNPDGAMVVSHDMRDSGPELMEAFVAGATSQGVDVTVIGLASTDQLWFASGWLDLPGAQFTASHNPAAYNGVKFCQRQAQPVSPHFLVELADLSRQIDAGTVSLAPAARPGQVTGRDLLDDYAAYLRSLVDLDRCRRLKVVIDAGNGMAGHTVPAVLGPYDLDLIGLYLDLDGSFPNHQPNPLVPENLVDAQRAVVQHQADLALVFDGDADRCFVIDERGEVVAPSTITALIAVEQLAREPGGVIVINTITSDAVRQIVSERGGRVVESRVGHTYVKAKMAEQRAIFGGEHSAHYYFRDFWGADTGLLAGLHVLARLGHDHRPLSELVAEYTRFVGSGEINSTVRDPDRCQAAVAQAFAGQGEVEWGDGVKVTGDGWWFNLRPSNTEPLLRLNVEARDTVQMASLRDQVLHVIATEEAV
ncbi:MAG: phosphomannomutase/phosphoglucomutase [Propionibacteriaceae bacterium]|jgi:phosphomannomutase|nr:phosphomannomutase/phosphoglucomutase [Propionibacteriaceae bacterium]